MLLLLERRRKPTQLGGFPFFSSREKLVSVKRSYLYHDYQAGDADVFSREPFVVWFQSPHTGETHMPYFPTTSPVLPQMGSSAECELQSRVYSASLWRPEAGCRRPSRTSNA